MKRLAHQKYHVAAMARSSGGTGQFDWDGTILPVFVLKPVVVHRWLGKYIQDLRHQLLLVCGGQLLQFFCDLPCNEIE